MTRRRYAWHVCSFDVAGPLRGRARTYEAVRAAVLEAGRFSCFEATESTRNADLFTRLRNDPALVVTPDVYPWTKVRRR